MATYITSLENHKDGSFRVEVRLGHRYERFVSMMDAQKWLKLMKETGNIGQLLVTLKEIVITAKQQIAYESCYAM